MDNMVGFCSRIDNIVLDSFMGMVGANFGPVLWGWFWACYIWAVWTCNEKFLCMVSNGHGMNPKIIAR